MSKPFFWICSVLIVILIGLNIVIERPAAIVSDGASPSGTADIGGAFTLTNQQGEKVDSASFLGKPMLIYFGFTHCQAICPTDMQNFTHVLKSLGSDGDKISAVIVTIDPARDTPERLKEWLKNFDPRIVGLTGTEEEIKAVTEAYKAYAQKIDNLDADAREAMGLAEGDYVMDHSTFTYLMDKNGKYVTHFGHNTKPQDIITQIKKLL